jgi:nitrous oxide reductase accessory protein NosL
MTVARTVRISLALFIVIAAFSLPVFGETLRCAECGMMVDLNSMFAAKIIQGDRTLYFCDLGDLLVYLNKKKLNDAPAEVRDYASGDWIDARKAVYVASENKFKTPMGWGIAAFKDRKSASSSGSPMDFDMASKKVK